MINTENIDKLFLELSQFTTATTKRELEYRKAINQALYHLQFIQSRNGSVIQTIGILKLALSDDWDSALARKTATAKFFHNHAAHKASVACAAKFGDDDDVCMRPYNHDGLHALYQFARDCPECDVDNQIAFISQTGPQKE